MRREYVRTYTLTISPEESATCVVSPEEGATSGPSLAPQSMAPTTDDDEDDDDDQFG